MNSRTITEAITFTPASRTLNFSAVTGFDFKRLISVINQTTGQIIFMPALGAGFTATVSGSVVTLAYDTTGMSSGDILQAQYSNAERQLVNARNGYAAISDSCTSLSNFGVVGSLASGDIVSAEGNAVGANWISFSLDPLSANTESRVEYGATFQMPFRASLGLSMSQRVIGQELAVEFVDTGSLLSAQASKSISAIQQATTTLTVTTSAPHGFTIGQDISIDGCSDSRFNYPSLTINTVPSPTQFTCLQGPNGAIPSVTAGPFASGTVYARSRLGRANDGTSLIFENITPTNAGVYFRAEGGDAMPGVAVANYILNHSATIQSTAGVQAVNAPGMYAFEPTTKFELICDPDAVQWLNKTMDGVAAQAQIAKREKVVPNPAATYKIRFRGNSNAGLTRPIAQIVSAVKTGTTTATIATATPHGLTTADFVQTYGIRDIANFPNLVAATAVASIIDANNFTVVIAGAVTATSYGGYVSRVNGGVLQQGVSAINAQSISRTSNIVSVVGNGTWAAAVIGDIINLVGIRDNSTGASLGLDGVYRVYNIATTTLTLEPVSGYAPTGADVTSTNCGGSIIKRTELRVHTLRVFPFDRFVTEIIGSNARAVGDIAQAIPVNVINNPAVAPTANSAVNIGQVGAGTLAAHSAALAGTPLPMGGRVQSALDTTLVNNDSSFLGITTAQQLMTKEFGSAENDFSIAAPAGGTISASTTPVTVQAAPAASLHNYYTQIVLNSDALGSATEFVLRDVALTLTTSVLSGNTLVTSASHGLAIGDPVVFVGVSGITGLTAGVTYYVLTVPSATSFTLAATPGGTTVTATGTPAAAQTLNHVIFRTKLQTAGLLTPLVLPFGTPLRGGMAVAQEVVTLTSATGAVYFAAQGYRSF